MKLKLTNNILAGAMFCAIGAAFLYMGQDYPLGTARTMGPGYFPRMVAILVMVFGALTALRSFIKDASIKHGGGPLALRIKPWPFIAVFAAVIAFALLVERVGLVPTLAVTVVLSRLAAPGARPLELLGLVAVVSAVIVGVFVYGLGVPLQLGF
jgi:hypothetical protein